MLSLQNCQIEEIELFSFSNLLHLRRLDLSYNKLDSIKKGLFDRLFNLDYLNLSSCRIKEIDENSLKDLRKLDTLDLSDNGLEEFSQSEFDEFKIKHGLESLKHANFHTFNFN